jgi:hypothetical protein
MKHDLNASHDIQLEDEDVAYIRLPRSSENPKIVKNINLSDIIAGYKGCDVVLDFTEDGTLVGIEILA